MYCAADDLIKRFERNELIQLTDKDGSTGDIVTDVLDQAIGDATATIDGYLIGRYSLPLTNPPANLNRLCADIARYYLYDDVLDDNHQASVRYKGALDYLKSVGKGDIRLALSTSDASASSTNLVQFESAGSVFERSKSKGFV